MLLNASGTTFNPDRKIDSKDFSTNDTGKRPRPKQIDVLINFQNHQASEQENAATLHLGAATTQRAN